MIVALIALFVSLSGVSYGVATGFIDSREIKNNEVRSIDIRNNEIRTRDLRNNEVRGIDIRNSTVQGRDIALNTVTGEDVKEDTLQKVPSALLADSATTADAVGGVKMQRSAYVAPRAPRRRSVLATSAPLTLTRECSAGPRRPLVASSRANRRRTRGRRRRQEDLPRTRLRPGRRARIVAVRRATPGGRVNVAFAALGRPIVHRAATSFTAEHRRASGRRRDDCGFFGHRPAGLDLDDHRQDHRAPLEALVDELGHVVVEMVLQKVDLA